MANLTFDYRSRVLGKEVQFNVVLPEGVDVPENGWKNSLDSKAYKSDEVLTFVKGATAYNVELNRELTINNGNFVYSGPLSSPIITFKMNNGVLESIDFSGNDDLNGTYTPAVKYKITEGNETTINVNDNKDALFTSDAPYNKFYVDKVLVGKVLIDSVVVDPMHYTHASGSTKVTLKASYLNTLANGKHTLTIVSTDGDASTTFTITRDAKSLPNNKYVIPKTGIE